VDDGLMKNHSLKEAGFIKNQCQRMLKLCVPVVE